MNLVCNFQLAPHRLAFLVRVHSSFIPLCHLLVSVGSNLCFLWYSANFQLLTLNSQLKWKKLQCCSWWVCVTSVVVLKVGLSLGTSILTASECEELGCLQRACWLSLQRVLPLHCRLPCSPANLLPPPQLLFQTAAIMECAEAVGHGSV